MTDRSRPVRSGDTAFTPPQRRAIVVAVKELPRRILGLGAVAALAFSSSGCSAAGGVVQGVGGLIQGLLSLAVSLLPFALAYYLYHRRQD